MKCTNESCPYRQGPHNPAGSPEASSAGPRVEPGPVECPAANNGCEGYKSEKGGRPNESLHPAHPKP